MNTIYQNDFSTWKYISIFIIAISTILLVSVIILLIKSKKWTALQYSLIVFSLCVVGFSFGLILLTLLTLLAVILYLIITGRKGEDFANHIKVILLTLITTTCCVFFTGDIIRDIKLENCLKKETCCIVEGVPNLMYFEEEYYRDEFVGYIIDFAIDDTVFKDLEQPFPLEALNAIKEGQKIKVYFYQDKHDIVILKMDII